GYFMTTPKFLWSLFEKLAPEIFPDLAKIQQAYGTKNFNLILNEVYPQITKIHFDKAILERVNRVDALVLPVDIGWSDVGTWEQLKEALIESGQENAIQGKAITADCQDSLFFNTSNQLIVGVDLKGMIVVNTGDVILVCPENSVPKIKNVIDKLADSKNEKLI